MGAQNYIDEDVQVVKPVENTQVKPVEETTEKPTETKGAS